MVIRLMELKTSVAALCSTLLRSAACGFRRSAGWRRRQWRSRAAGRSSEPPSECRSNRSDWGRPGSSEFRTARRWWRWRVPPQRQQPDRTGAHEPERVEVGVARDPAPVQAGAREAVRAGQVEGSDRSAGLERRTDDHRRADGFIGGACGAMADDHHPSSGDLPGEYDRARKCRAHLLTCAACKVDSTVAGPVGTVGRVERLDHLGNRVQRPDADRIRRARNRQRGRQGSEQQGRGEGHRNQEPAHERSMLRGRDGRSPYAPLVVDDRTPGEDCGEPTAPTVVIEADGTRLTAPARIGTTAARRRTLGGPVRPGPEFARPQTTTPSSSESDRPWASILSPPGTDQAVGSRADDRLN